MNKNFFFLFDDFLNHQDSVVFLSCQSILVTLATLALHLHIHAQISLDFYLMKNIFYLIT